MRIREHFSPEHVGLRGTNTLSEGSTSRTDIEFFTSTLEHSTPPISAAARLGAPSLLASASEQLIRSTDGMSKSLKAISKHGNREELAKFPNQLSNSLFLSQILVKSLGKTTQCIDKICNLQ